MKKDFLNLKRSRWLLLSLFALFVGVSPTWAQVTESFEDVTLVNADSWGRAGELSNGWICVNSSGAKNSIGLGTSENYGYYLLPEGNTGEKSLASKASNSNTEYLVIPVVVKGKISFYAKKTGNTNPYIYIYLATDNGDGTYSFSTSNRKVQYLSATTWTKYEIDLGDTETIPVINMYRAAIDDFTYTPFVETYKKPKTITVNSILAETATVEWTKGSSDDSETGWNLEYKKTSDDTWTEVHNIDKATTSYDLTSLVPNTSYDIRVRALYDANNSDWKTTSFKTSKVSTPADGFEDDFETDKGWELINGTVPNKWIRGTDTNNGGSYSLYISNDGSSYPTSYGSYSLVYAAKLFHFEVGEYTITYDWKCNGEGTYDFMRVGLAPASVELAASTSYSNLGSGSTLPTGWTMYLDGDSYLGGNSAWANKAVNFTIETAGNYQIVFAWRNDYSGGSNPAAIDNVSIAMHALSTPSTLTVNSVAATSATLTWTPTTSETEWEVAYGTAGFDPTSAGTIVTATTATNYVLSGLTPETEYDVYVRAKSGSDVSGWSTKVSFTTPEKYPKPTGLTSSDVAATTTTISWTKNGTETAWEYSCSASSDVPAEDGSYATVDATSQALTGLTENTTYYVYVRAKVGSEHSAWSDMHSFTTTQTAIDLTTGSYADDFESANNWVFVNGSITNAWAWGTATNNGGEKAMYISSDGGISNTYTGANTMVYATKLFTLAQGKYDISYDWKAKGESNYDYMRVAIVPAATILTASNTTLSGFGVSTLPSEWIAIDDGSKLNLSNDFATKAVEATIETAGDYKVVFAWRNDGDAYNPPAAIDNFSIAFQACPKPTGVVSSDVKGTKATLSWNAADETTWEVYISTESTKPAANQAATAAPSTNTYTFTGLTAETTYYAWVRAVKGAAKSDWVGVNFTTDVQYPAPTGLAIARQGTTATLTWTAADTETAWEVVSSTDSSANPDELAATNVTSATHTLEGLTTGSTYYVWVRSIYGSGADEHSAWVDGTFALTYLAANPGSVDGNGISNVTFGTGAEVVNCNTSKSPTYQDNSAQIGGVTAGLTANVDITYATGYTYGTVIWVDWNQNYEFEESEVVYKGTSAKDNPTTLNASFAVASTQTPGNYRMRIAGGDNCYDSFVGGGAYDEAYPYTTSNYCIVHDYTLKVNEAANYSMAISGADVSESTIAFGTVKNTTTTKTFTITNDGAEELTDVSVVSSNAEVFTVSETGFDLASGATKDITVTFVKAVDGDYSETITVSQTNVATPLTLTATATYVTPTPATIAISQNGTAIGETVAFGTVGKAKSKTFTVSNTGEATLTISSIASSNTTDFTVTPATLDIVGGETGEFTVNFLWNGEALNVEKTATITLTSNATDSPTTFAVTGTRDDLWMVDFEDVDPLNGWENSGFTVKATAGSSNNVTLTSNYAVSTYSSSNSTLVTPLLKATAGDKLTFDAYFCWGNDPLKVEYSTDGTDFDADGHTLYSFTGSPSFGSNGTTTIEITAPITGDFYLRFTTCYSNAIDNIEGFKLAPAREHDAVIASSNIYSVGYQYKEYTASVTVKEKAGKDDEVVTAELWVNNEKVATESDITLTANSDKVISLSFTPEVALSDVNAYIKVYNANLDLTSETSSVTIYAAMVLDETVGTIESTGNKPSMVVKYTAKNGWNTICMPFALTDDILKLLFGEGYKAYQFKSYDTAEDVISFQAATSFTAKKPYLIYATAAPANTDGVKLFGINLPSGTSPSVDTSNGVTFQGTYAPVAAGSLIDWYGVTNGGEIRKAGSGAYMKGFRAFFTGVPETANARIALVDETTGITTILSQKDMEESVYNLNGQKLQQTKKGLNIVNGKKVVVK